MGRQRDLDLQVGNLLASWRCGTTLRRVFHELQLARGASGTLLTASEGVIHGPQTADVITPRSWSYQSSPTSRPRALPLPEKPHQGCKRNSRTGDPNCNGR
jgi:hypothetical protein